MQAHLLTPPPLINEVARFIYTRLITEGYQCLIAGGWVRDLLMQRPSQDLDLATSASPEEVAQIFDRTLALGKRFGSVVVLISHEDQTFCYEVTTFRQDGKYTNGRHPNSITPSNPYEDAQRRDFTINGLFYDPKTHLIIDYVNGLDDLHEHMIRAIGNPFERFEEDRLRILRAIRFAVVLNFTLEAQTSEAITCFSSDLTEYVSAERIYQEMSKIHDKECSIQAFELMQSHGLIQSIFNLNQIPANLFIRYSIFAERNIKPSLISVMAWLWPIDNKKLSLRLVDQLLKLKLSKKEQQFLKTLNSLIELYFKDPEVKEFYLWLNWFKAESSQEAIAWLYGQNCDKKWLDQIDYLMTHPLFEISESNRPFFQNQDLKDFNLVAGPNLGAILRWLYKQACQMFSADKKVLLTHLQIDPRGARLLSLARRNSLN
jgi:poly(A) polymerase